jgi:putative ABC transport system permease protein
VTPREPLWRRYRNLVQPDTASDVDDELDFHFDRLVEDLIAQGVEPSEAARRARQRIGDREATRDACLAITRRRERRTDRKERLAGLGQDLRYALRGLLNTPGFTLLTVLTLAIGIGANTAVFSVVDGVLLRPLPYGEPDRLVMVWEHNLPRNRTRNVVNPENAIDWRARAHSFKGMSLFGWTSLTLTGGDVAEPVRGRVVNPNFFDVVGVQPRLGRGFVASDTNPGSPRVVVLSYGLWQRRFGGDPAVIGSAIPVAGGTKQVVGVMPRSFQHMPRGSEEYWEAATLGNGGGKRQGRWAMVVARLADGVTPEQAGVEMRNLGQQLAQEYPDFNAGWTVDVVPMLEDVVGDASDKLRLALGSVLLVLFVACANVANLLLVRAAARRHELTVRAALGASRGRVLRLWLAESSLLVGLGVVLGWALAWAMIRGLIALAPADIPRLDAIRMDFRVFLFTALVSAGVAGILALAVAAATSRTLLPGSTRTTATGAMRRFRDGLVVVQVALALVLLVGAGLLLRSLQRLEQTDPGFDPTAAISADVELPTALYPDAPQWRGFFQTTLDQLRATPGVEAAGLVNYVPLTGIGAGTSFYPLDRPQPEPGLSPAADIRVADRGFFQVLRIPLLRGRFLDTQDDTLPHVLINRTLAEQFWPSQDPLGKTLRVSWIHEELPQEIVGVVGDTPTEGLDQKQRPMIYFYPPASPQPGFYLVVRGRGGTESLASAVREVVRTQDRSVPVSRVASLDAQIAASLQGHRSPMLLLALFSMLALVLAVIGLYGVLAYAVRLRSREIGVRMALGARPPAMIWLVVQKGLQLTLVGLALGTLAAFAATRVLRGLLYGTSTTDPRTFVLVAVTMLAVAVVASLIPARRASRVDPMMVLRSE